MDFFVKIVIFPTFERDWLIRKANFFFLLLLGCSGFSQTSPFLIQKDTVKVKGNDTVTNYVSLRNAPEVVYDFPDYAPKIDSTADSLLKSAEPSDVRSVFLPVGFQVKARIKDILTDIRPFFSPHSLLPKSSQVMERKGDINNWAFIILVIGFVLYAGVQFRQSKRLAQIFRAFFASRFLNQLMRGTDLYKERLTYNLFSMFLLVTPLFIFEINAFYGFYHLQIRPLTEFLFYLEIFLLNVGLYFFKILVIRAAGSVFKTTEVTSEYLLTLLVFSLVQGVLMLLITSLVVFTASFVILRAGIFLAILLYGYQLIRGFLIGLKNSEFSFFYLFLFFFTIEIMPLLIIIKLLGRIQEI